jgi:AraC-like DNA-binding protein
MIANHVRRRHCVHGLAVIIRWMNRDANDAVRWRIRTAEAWQEVSPGSVFWHDNRRRPGGAVVFQYTRAGSLTVRLGGRRLRVPPGSAALLRFGDAVDYGLDPADASGYACTYLTFQGAGLQAHWRELTDLHGVVVPFGETVLNEALALVSARREAPDRQAAQIHAFVMRLYGGPEPGDGGAADRAIAAVRSDPCSVRSLKEFAAMHGVSREHLARAFHARTGEAAWAFVTRARLARARELLADPSLTVAETARLCGYASARVLARNLKAATGRPPEAWRR